MSLSLRDAQIINQLAEVLYNFLPGSGNANTAFPLAANKTGLGDFWEPGSKKPAIIKLLTHTLQHRRNKITDLMIEVVKQSIVWRKNNPLQREEVLELNKLLAKFDIKIPELYEADFLETLPSSNPIPTKSDQSNTTRSQVPDTVIVKLRTELLQASSLEPQARGFAFEGFLSDLFDAYGLAPRKAFKLIGEQIDGSFKLNNELYLLEAKWQAAKTGQSDLLTFSGKVQSKAEWTRGLFISNSGFTEEGLQAFGTGRRTNIICMDGLDLYHVISGSLSFIEVLEAKTRRAAETNRAHVPVRELFANVV